MFAIRYFKMFVRSVDGLMTDNKSAAMLFDTVEDAKIYINDVWITTFGAGCPGAPVEIIEVETKVIMHKAGKVVWSL